MEQGYEEEIDMGGGDTVIQAAQQPSYSESMRESLQAQIDLAPALFKAESSGEFGRPAYAAMETDILRDTLLGQGKFVPTGSTVTTQPGTAGATSFGQAAMGEQAALSQGIMGLTEAAKGAAPYREGSGGTNWRDYVKTGEWSKAKADTTPLYDIKKTTGGRYGDQVTMSLEEQLGGPQGLANLQMLGQLGYIKKPITQVTQGDYNTALQGFITDAGINPNAEIPGTESATWYSDPSTVFQKVSKAQTGRGATMAFGGGTAPTERVTTTGEMRRGGGLLELLGGEEAGMRDGEFQGLSTFGSDVAAQAATAQRGADIGDVETLGLRATEALKAADPLSASLLETMGTQAQEGLAAGRGLSPRQRREAEQSARMGWEARGLIRDPEAVVSEVESVMDAAGREEAKRRAFAGQVMGLSQGMTADPFMAILGRPSGASQQIAQSGLGSAQYGLAAGPELFDPSGGLNYMINQQTNQANLQAAQAAASATKQAGMFGGLGQAIGGAASAIPWCWIAREVYGESNPKWLLFREWMLNKAPEWLRGWYLLHGPRVAEWLKDKPLVKARIKTFMDSKILEGA